MARKAIQGYPEKSYYDNTRYLGMVATTDPLNEGLFKHLVNFDISDTGQSVQPRDGFITTTLNNNGLISLSNKTIIFKDNNVNQHLIYDLNTNTSYIADVSAYKLTNKLLPITTLVTYIEWTTAVTFLINQVTFIKTYYDAFSGTLAEKYAGTRDYIRQYLKIIPDTKVNHIYDENGISKTLLRVEFVQPDPNNPNTILNQVNFILQMYYRKDAITLNGAVVSEYVPILGTNVLQNGNTLIFEIVDTFTHPTLGTTDRNLAVSKSIIPEVFQTLYTTNTRPSGHISNLGNFVYIYDNVLNYVNSFIYKNTNYNIKPYFTLNPAYIDLNNAQGSTDKWAYRLEVFNTSVELNNTTKHTVFTSPWIKYQGPLYRPEELFTNNRTSVISLGNTNKSDNHYLGARFIIFVVPNTSVNTTSKVINNNGVITNFLPGKQYPTNNFQLPAGETLTINDIQSKFDGWYNIVNNVKDLSTLRSAINSLKTNAYFYLYNLNEAASTGTFKTFDDTFQSSATVGTNTFEIPSSEDDEYSVLLTADELLEKVEQLGVFKTNYNVAFKLIPFASRDVINIDNTITSYTSDSRFATQIPYYYPGNPSGLLTVPVDRHVQDTTTGQVYKQTTTPTGNTYVTVGSTATPITSDFIEDAFYLDLRTNSYYRWDNPTGKTGVFTVINNPGTTTVKYRWFFATIQYWQGYTANIVLRQNTFVNNNFKFYKSINGFYSVETDLNKLSNNENPTLINFTSSNLFIYNTVDQIPYYWNTNPNNIVEAPVNTIIQVDTQNNSSIFYRQTASPYGKTWVQHATSNTTVTAFIKGRRYFDTRTSKQYYWYNDNSYQGTLTEVEVNNNLNSLGFFDKNLNGIIYMRPYQESEFLNENGQTKTFEELETLKLVWNSTSLTQTFNLNYGYDDLTVTYIEKQLTKEPIDISYSTALDVFEDSQLLTWRNNVLYISEPGRYYWFKATKKIEFAEEIVKALQYKTIILVFTTQHLYAVYRVETTVTQLNPATNQIEQNVTGVAWLKQIVLYNLLVSKQYADVIQIFNQMVLFYSQDGQLFMIRPSTTIDDQTRFSIQYFNKAVNDVLINYHEYMNERLATYNKSERVTKDQVKIKALVSINYIKIFYYVPGVITYMLIYDVLNNRYYAYDTLTFTDVYDKLFIESGELYLTEHNTKVYFSMPYVEQNVKDNYTDMTVVNGFKKEGINCLIDTGNLNLNNHLHKRFRDLHVMFKNLNSSNLLFNLETNIDDIIAKPFYDTQLKVKDINGISYFVPVTKANQNDLIELVDINQISETATDAVKYSLTNNLFENNNVLMDFSEYTSSKLLTHRTSILGLGKIFRLKLQFISKGLYKLQHFGIIYKERRI
jgi:hypothetical protein